MVYSLWKTLWQFFRKLNIELLCDPAAPFLSICMCKSNKSKNWEICTNVHSSIIHKGQKVETAQCLWMNEWILTCSIYMWRNIFQPLEAMKFCHIRPYRWTLKRFLMKETRHQRTNVVWFRLCEVSRVVKLIETWSRIVVTRHCGVWGMRICLMDSVFQFWKMKKFWWWMVVMVAQQCEYTECQ